VRRRDQTTVGDYEGVINGYLLDEFGSTALAAITPDDIDAYKERLIVEGRLSHRTIVRHLTVLHGIFERAKRVWKLTDNPASADLVGAPRSSTRASSTRSTATRCSCWLRTPPTSRTPPSM
jgi:hypothetical protein